MRHLLVIALLLPTIVAAEPLRVFVSVPPLQTFVERIGGEHVDVHTMVRPGYNPATYDPTPKQISALARARLYVRIGVPFEHAWMDRIRSASPQMRILDVRAGITPGDTTTRGPDPEHTGHDDRHESDPHAWTSPPLVKHMVDLILDKLSELDPQHRADYARNHAAYVRELDDLDRDIRSLLDPLQHRRFMVLHPAWGYFADTYGLVQVPIEHGGKQPGARSLAALIDQARAEDIRVVFVQPQFDRRQALQVARAIDGEVIAVDPLAANYADNLRQVARQFAAALQP